MTKKSRLKTTRKAKVMFQPQILNLEQTFASALAYQTKRACPQTLNLEQMLATTHSYQTKRAGSGAISRHLWRGASTNNWPRAERQRENGTSQQWPQTNGGNGTDTKFYVMTRYPACGAPRWTGVVSDPCWLTRGFAMWLGGRTGNGGPPLYASEIKIEINHNLPYHWRFLLISN